MYIIEFNKRNIDLSKAEFLSLFPRSIFLDYGEYVLVDSVDLNNSNSLLLLSRLAYTNSVYTILFSTPYISSSSFVDVATAVSHYDFNSLIHGSYAIDFNSGISLPLRKKLLSSVWHALQKPVVNLNNPTHSLFFFAIRDAIYCTERCFVSEHSFTKRRAHLRTHLKPISLDPQLARCLVNLTGCGSLQKSKADTNTSKVDIQNSGASMVDTCGIVDTFCGTGGILIEAVLSDLHASGSDISQEMISLCHKEFDSRKFSTTSYSLSVADYFVSRKKIPYLVTDLPYGKSTKNVSSDFYAKVFKKSDSLVTKRAVIMVAEHLQILDLLAKLNLKHLKLTSVFYYYVHGSLTRQILVFDIC